MKNSIFYLFIVALIFASCKEVPDVANKEETADTEQAKTVKEIDPDISCFTSDHIYPSTAWVWAQSWTSYVNLNENNDPSLTKMTSPELFFTAEKLNELRSKNKDANGVLLYYILKGSELDPSLAMVNLVNCQRVNECDKSPCVLVKWHKGKEEFIPLNELGQYQANWQLANGGRIKTIKGFAPVRAYNYSWKTLDELYDSKNHTGGIRVKLGVRTLGPGEIVNFTPKNGLIEFVTGNIVVCNILTAWDGLKGKSFRDVLNELDEDEELDFAMPCPQYCGEE